MLHSGEVTELAWVSPPSARERCWCLSSSTNFIIRNMLRQMSQQRIPIAVHCWESKCFYSHSFIEDPGWKSLLGEGTGKIVLFVWLISSPTSDLIEHGSKLSLSEVTFFSHRKTFSKERPFPQAAQPWIYPLLSQNQLYSQIPSAKNADLSNLRHRAGDMQSALTLCSLPAQPCSPTLAPAPWPQCQTQPNSVWPSTHAWCCAGALLPTVPGCLILRNFHNHISPLVPFLHLTWCAWVSPCCISRMV